MTTPSYKPTAQPSQGTRDTSNSTSTQFLYYTLALVAIIASVCFISFCYRSLFLSRFFSCGKNVDPNVEVIIETDAVIELEANYASADTCPADDVIFAGIASSTKAKSYVHSDASIFYAESPAVLVTTIAQESSMGDNDNTRARIIGVMDNVQLVSSTARTHNSNITTIPTIRMTERNDSSTTSNTPYPYLNTERNRPHTHIVSNSNDDNDFLIQTERNMVELNENITRIAHLNEAQVASGSPPLPTNYDRENYRRYQHPFGNVYGGAARGLIGRSSGDSLFYSEHSNNRRTQAMHSNDPCAQQ